VTGCACFQVYIANERKLFLHLLGRVKIFVLIAALRDCGIIHGASQSVEIIHCLLASLHVLNRGEGLLGLSERLLVPRRICFCQERLSMACCSLDVRVTVAVLVGFTWTIALKVSCVVDDRAANSVTHRSQLVVLNCLQLLSLSLEQDVVVLTKVACVSTDVLLNPCESVVVVHTVGDRGIRSIIGLKEFLTSRRHEGTSRLRAGIAVILGWRLLFCWWWRHVWA